MATYAEIIQAVADQTLTNKVRVGIVMAAEAIRTESGATTNHANRLLWAKAAFNDPESKVHGVMWALMAQNSAATLAAILAASDAQVLTAVSAVVDVLSG